MIGWLTGLGKDPSCHVIFAFLAVTDLDLMFTGGLGATTLCK